MGSYDEVHTGYRCGQVKALGKGFRRLVPGQAVILQPCVMTSEQHDQFGPEMPARPEVRDFDVQMALEFLHVRDGVITGWDENLDLGVPLFDYTGWPVQHPQPVFTIGDTPFYDTVADHDRVVPRWDCRTCAEQRELHPQD